jgi:ribosomal protein L12E/L44/L45/RPP1/RPP2
LAVRWEPSATSEDICKILESVGTDVEEDKLQMLFMEVDGRDVAELLAAGKKGRTFPAKVSSVSTSSRTQFVSCS